MTRPDLKIVGATHEAARYACETWHYSHTIPAGKTVKWAVWENFAFIGVVIFSRGATPNVCRPYGLTQLEGCELTRIALTKHQTPVSRIMAIAVRLLKKTSPGMRLVVSYADPDQQHVGAIYQAAGWIYTGFSRTGGEYSIDGVRVHSRTIHSRYGTQQQCLELLGDRFKIFKSTAKHRYVLPLDDEIRTRVSSMQRPYPKRAKVTGDVAPQRPGQCDSDPPAPTNTHADVST